MITGRGGQQAAILSSMSKLVMIEEKIRALSTEELAEFRQWFAEFDAAAWDRQLERDVKGWEARWARR
jgi:hypothetical protein